MRYVGAYLDSLLCATLVGNLSATFQRQMSSEKVPFDRHVT